MPQAKYGIGDMVVLQDGPMRRARTSGRLDVDRGMLAAMESRRG